MVWLTHYQPANGWFDEGAFHSEWMWVVANGAIIYGMIPVKDAVISMVNKGLRA
jgi:hypothetical protein